MSLKLVFITIMMADGICGNDRNDQFTGFLVDLIQEWNLRMPTVVVQNELPNACRNSSLVLCVQSMGEDTSELARHIAHGNGAVKHDSLIFGPIEDQRQLLNDIEQVQPLMF